MVGYGVPKGAWRHTPLAQPESTLRNGVHTLTDGKNERLECRLDWEHATDAMLSKMAKQVKASQHSKSHDQSTNRAAVPPYQFCG